MKKLVYLLIMLLIPFNVFAKTTTTKKPKVVNNFKMVCDKLEQISINEQIICRVSVNTGFLFNEINLEIPNIDGFEISDVRSNSSKVWKITRNKNQIKATSEEMQNGLQEFGIILLKAVKSGSYEFKVSNVNLVNSTTNDSKEMESASQLLKVISTDNLLKAIYVNDELLDNFSSNTMTYDYYITNEESIKIAVESSNEFATINGAGEFDLDSNIEKNIIPIEVLSEDGVSRVYTINVIRNNFERNDIDKSLDSIIVKNDKGNTLLINYKKDVYEYNFDVDLNTKSLEIVPELSNEETDFVKNYGKQEVNLKPGTNVIIIKVKDKDGQVLNYVFNVTKPLANKSDNNYIKSLEIRHHELSFSKRVKNYTLAINKGETSLEINPILDSDRATYSIVGNENLKSGSVIKIIVTAENEEKLTYKINIVVKKTNYTPYIILGMIVVLLVYLETRYRDKLVQLFKKKKQPVRRKVTNVKVVVKEKPKKKKTKKKSTTKKTTNKKNSNTNNSKTTNSSKKASTKKSTQKKNDAK